MGERGRDPEIQLFVAKVMFLTTGPVLRRISRPPMPGTNKKLEVILSDITKVWVCTKVFVAVDVRAVCLQTQMFVSELFDPVAGTPGFFVVSSYLGCFFHPGNAEFDPFPNTVG
jgi:hypothetical protein